MQLKANTYKTQCKSQYNSCIQTASCCDGGKHTSNSSVAAFASIAIVPIGSSVGSNSYKTLIVHSVLPLPLPPLALPPLALLVVPGGGLGGPSGFLVSKWRPAQPHNECQVQELKHIQHTADKDQSCRSHTVAIFILEAIQALHDCMLCRFIS